MRGFHPARKIPLGPKACIDIASDRRETNRKTREEV